LEPEAMEKKHALITGGSSGIGLALAFRLAAEGYDISIIARREAVLKSAAADISKHFIRENQRVFAFSADLADAPRAEAAVRACTAELGVPDLVVTSAGIAVPGYFEDLPLDAFERSMAINYFGSLYVVRAVLPAMRERKSGRVVLVSSGAGLMGLFGYATYSPTKFALRGLAEGLRAELKADNIGISIVYPPDTETPMLAEEHKIRPEETRVMSSLIKPWTAQAVADCILRGVKAGKYAITPGFTMTLMNRSPGIMLPLLHWYCDRLAEGVRRNRPSHEEQAAAVFGR
jgi:3-dehydrosphinganine reductase